MKSLGLMLTHHVGKRIHHIVWHPIRQELHHLTKVSHSIEAHIRKSAVGSIKPEATIIHRLSETIVRGPLLILTRSLLLSR